MVVQAYEYEKSHLLTREEAEKQKQSNTDDDASKNNGESPNYKKQKLETTAKEHEDVRPDVHLEPLRGFFISTNSVMQTPLFQRLDAELRDRRETLLREKGWNITDEERQQPTKPSS